LSVSVPRRLRAPQQDQAILSEPPLAEVGELLAANRQRLAQPAAPLLGRDWADLRLRARQAAVSAARDCLRRSGEPLPESGTVSLLMAGHQPELFHPGVWVKNFALQGLARQHGGTPINLVVDNDTAKASALRVPLLREGQTATIPFDTWTGEVPYEERRVQDEARFAHFADRVAPAWQDWGYVPLLPAFWDEVRRQAEHTPLLGERLAAARRALERAWGCHNLELPISLLCQTEPFAWFACHLLTHLPLFHTIYNTCVHDYRRLHGIRSRSHPVPDLAAEGPWKEVPFWAWRSGQTQRGRLLARLTGTAVELRIGNEPGPTLPLNQDGSSAALVRGWLDLERQGLKVRSRALTNTIFARLFLADLFVHGIGGAKYDELTDAIIRRFYGFEPPGYLVLSATLRLPLPSFLASPEDRRRLAGQLRDVHYNPQRHLDAATQADPEVAALVAQKQRWAAQLPVQPNARRERFQQLRALTGRLRPYLADRERKLAHQLADCDWHLQVNRVVQRRDYAFCLYPEALLRGFCTRFLGQAL
jgi:hypothetical protein